MLTKIAISVFFILLAYTTLKLFSLHNLENYVNSDTQSKEEIYAYKLVLATVVYFVIILLGVISETYIETLFI